MQCEPPAPPSESAGRVARRKWRQARARQSPASVTSISPPALSSCHFPSIHPSLVPYPSPAQLPLPSSPSARSPAMASDATPAVPAPGKPAPAKRRGSYNCGRCGLPKKGHVCSLPVPAAAAASTGAGDKAGQPQSQPPPPLRRALQFDDPAAAAAAAAAPASVSPSPPASASAVVLNPMPLAVAAPAPAPTPQAAGEGKKAAAAAAEVDEEEYGGGGDYLPLPWVEVGEGRRLPGEVLMDLLRRLGARGVAAAAGVSRGWRECARHVWYNTEVLRLRASGFRPVAALMARCTALASLVLTMESDVDSTLLACIAFSCPNLQSLEISMVNSSANRITGGELSKFVSERQSLSVLKLNGCGSLGFLNVSSSSLLTLWISGLCSLTKTVMNCPNLNELSLEFLEQDNDFTDLVALMDSLGRTSPNLRAMHIASIHLCNEAVFALETANLRGLCKLSLALGSKITDAAVASIVRSYASLELLDLSGSGITDNGLRMISNVLSNTLTYLLLAMCPNITSFGVHVAVAQLPLLRLMDCGNSICATPQPEAGRSYFGDITGAVKFCSNFNVHRNQPSTCQQLSINHSNLRKLSLWGCSGIDALCVNCPELVDLNLNYCTNLHQERLRIQCPKLKDVHALGCNNMLIAAIKSQVLNDFEAIVPWLPHKRNADGSKRVQVPTFMMQQRMQFPEKWGKPQNSHCSVHVD